MNKPFLRELLDKSVPFHKEAIKDYTSYSFQIFGMKIEVQIYGRRNHPGELYEISFTRNRHFMQGKPVSMQTNFKFWATVRECMKDFLKDNPEMFGFSFTGTDTTRGFYEKTAPILAQQLGMKFRTEDFVTFEIYNPNMERATPPKDEDEDESDTIEQDEKREEEEREEEQEEENDYEGER